jgi:hypothetical protein
MMSNLSTFAVLSPSMGEGGGETQPLSPLLSFPAEEGRDFLDGKSA